MNLWKFTDIHFHQHRPWRSTVQAIQDLVHRESTGLLSGSGMRNLHLVHTEAMWHGGLTWAQEPCVCCAAPPNGPLSTAAPRHDLTMWYDLKRYRQYDRVISDAALSSVRRHLWYLCPELVVLALFDYHTTLEDKQVMAVTLVNTVRPQAFGTGKPGQPAFNPISAKLTEEKPSLTVFSLSVCGCCSTFWDLMLHGCMIVKDSAVIWW